MWILIFLINLYSTRQFCSNNNVQTTRFNKNNNNWPSFEHGRSLRIDILFCIQNQGEEKLGKLFVVHIELSLSVLLYECFCFSFSFIYGLYVTVTVKSMCVMYTPETIDTATGVDSRMCVVFFFVMVFDGSWWLYIMRQNQDICPTSAFHIMFSYIQYSYVTVFAYSVSTCFNSRTRERDEKEKWLTKMRIIYVEIHHLVTFTHDFFFVCFGKFTDIFYRFIVNIFFRNII